MGTPLKLKGGVNCSPVAVSHTRAARSLPLPEPPRYMQRRLERRLTTTMTRWLAGVLRSEHECLDELAHLGAPVVFPATQVTGTGALDHGASASVVRRRPAVDRLGRDLRNQRPPSGFPPAA